MQRVAFAENEAFKAVFTLGAQALVPGHRHKMVLSSDTGYPIC